MVEWICLPKQSVNIAEAGTVDCLSCQTNLFPIWSGAGLVCLSVYRLICLCDEVSVCLHIPLSAGLSGFLYPDGVGTLPALCHMISLEAAGVKLIWSGLKAYERLMRCTNCSHLNCPFPPLILYVPLVPVVLRIFSFIQLRFGKREVNYNEY